MPQGIEFIAKDLFIEMGCKFEFRVRFRSEKLLVFEVLVNSPNLPIADSRLCLKRRIIEVVISTGFLRMV